MTSKEKKFRQRIADVVDCEGSIGIYHYAAYRKNGKSTHTWHPALVIAQKKREHLEDIQEILGGELCRGNGSYRLKWTHRRAVKIVRYILPDLCWKKLQGVLFLNAMATWPQWHRGARIPASITIERVKLANSVNALNEGERTRVVYRVIPSQVPDVVNEANDGEGVTVIHERLKP